MSLINTLDAPGEFDAATKLRPGEPYFMLIGRDGLAPDKVLAWARENRQRAMDDHDRGLISAEDREDELRKSSQAEEIAWAMQAYKANWEPTDPDPPRASATTSYSGHQLPPETQAADALQRARSRAAAALHNAVAELAELEKLVAPETALGMCAAHGVADLQARAEMITPPRPVIDRARDMDHARD